MLEKILKFLNENSDALGVIFGSGILIVIFSGLYKFTIGLFREIKNRNTRTDENFSFKVLLPNSNVAKEILGGEDNNPLADRNIPYEQRVAGRNTRQEIETILSKSRWVLITGKTGLGKTREAINVAESLCKEGWTILYLTRERWLSPPAKLPNGIPERKILFFLDDVNRKMYASHVEQPPRERDYLLQPLVVPLQNRIFETLQIFEKLCGKNEILVIATARDEKYIEFPDEPSEWDKLEFDKYADFWKKFTVYELPEADDQAEVNLLQDTTRIAEIQADPSEFSLIAKRNDGTFSNLVENLRNAHNKKTSLRSSIFRDTLKGTWEERYQEIINRNSFSKYFYDAVEVARDIGLELTFYNIFSIAQILAGKDPLRFKYLQNRSLLRYLIKIQNILKPRDGQIEAKKYRIELKKHLPHLYFQITKQYYSTINIWLRIYYFDLVVRFVPKKYFLKEDFNLFDNFLKQILPIAAAMNNVGNAYSDFGFYEQAIAFHNKSILLKRGDIQVLFSRKYLSSSWAGLGRDYYLQKKYDNALSSFQKAIEIIPKNRNYLIETGIVYIALGKLEEARETFGRVIEIQSKDEIAWYDLAYSYCIMKEYQKALEVYKKAIELLPDSGLLQIRLTGVLFKLDLVEEANNQLNIAKPMKDNVDLYTHAALEAICGNKSEAISLLRMALDQRIVSVEWAICDSDFDNIRGSSEFEEMIRKFDYQGVANVG